MFDGYYGHMFGWGLAGASMMIISWAAIITLVAFIVKTLGNKDVDGNAKAIDILKERYAKGEITKEEFEAKKKDLTS
ncbi:MAG: SHOCT domain-containing protein [bacterium]|nr:SHOCT domain-containing protein [bacterium]